MQHRGTLTAKDRGGCRLHTSTFTFMLYDLIHSRMSLPGRNAEDARLEDCHTAHDKCQRRNICTLGAGAGVVCNACVRVWSRGGGRSAALPGCYRYPAHSATGTTYR